ncbi:MAG: adenosylmethionine--8-amino-7-oxononanoate transaminase [Candidatus Omnitrophica bacterium]|nr:adenosylmethionine--8-amino-7-oxononanoate transaminase [Candidatus Omnitrophota bacterium]
MRHKGIFITGTDTDVGKTVATLALGVLLQEKGIDVGIMKPVQCAGQDAAFLKKSLNIQDPINQINPYYAPEPLSPHLAFARRKKTINIPSIKRIYAKLASEHDLMLVEGAGGLMVPLKKDYLILDLIKDLDLDVVIVARLSLGTINHTLLTVRQAEETGLNVRGVIFNQAQKGKIRIPEATNPDVIRRYAKVKILGIIPYLKDMRPAEVRKACRPRIDLRSLLSDTDSQDNRVQRLADQDKEYLWHPFTQMRDWLNEEPLVIDQAKGSYLIDTKGNRYLDGVSSLWVNVHGHGQKSIDAALKNQINRLSHSTLLGLSNTPAIELAEELVKIAPKGLQKVFYSDNGSTSVEIAIKMAYQYWQNTGRKQKRNIVHLANSYHGDTLGSVSVGGIDLFHKVYRDLVFKTITIDFPDCYRAPEGEIYPAYAFKCIHKFGQMLKSCHKTIAAFVVEPIVQGAAGMIMWPKGVLKQLRELCAKYDVIFIVDEVATGFGRTGKMFACEHERVSPDILCLAKGITGGYLPLAATLTTKKIFDGFVFDYKDQKTFFHGHTFTGNPLCCAAALANLKVFKKEHVLQKLQPKIKFLSLRLKEFYGLSHVGDVRQRGFMAGIELVKDRGTKEPYPWEEKIGVRVCQETKKRGVILRPLGNVIVLMPPLSMAVKELDKLCDATYWAVEKVTGENSLHPNPPHKGEGKQV